ncbi:unnamed protein product [Hymenolepis diminuta]|uniref:Uncharacterized protein n=1 Tax=Hymenolepis diminuta TaxID=6216 RepID=A0A564YV62_HYMDI|nr:unnamed protein product [Hymenolepis diminuta]
MNQQKSGGHNYTDRNSSETLSYYVFTLPETQTQYWLYYDLHFNRLCPHKTRICKMCDKRGH